MQIPGAQRPSPCLRRGFGGGSDTSRLIESVTVGKAKPQKTKSPAPQGMQDKFADSISRVLCQELPPQFIIYLRRQSPVVSSSLPLGIGRATLNCRYTRPCNPQGVLPRNIAAPAVGSYPAFSPLPLRAVILCYATIPSRTSSR